MIKMGSALLPREPASSTILVRGGRRASMRFEFAEPKTATIFRRVEQRKHHEGRVMARRVLSRVRLTVQDRQVDAEAIFDTGSTRSFVSLPLAEKLGYMRYDKPKEVLLATKDKKASMVGELAARVAILGYELPLSHVFGVIEGLNHDIVIGMDIMEPYEILVDAKGGRVSYKRFPPTIEII
jgi:hypothetical protein